MGQRQTVLRWWGDCLGEGQEHWTGANLSLVTSGTSLCLSEPGASPGDEPSGPGPAVGGSVRPHTRGTWTLCVQDTDSATVSGHSRLLPPFGLFVSAFLTVKPQT